LYQEIKTENFNNHALCKNRTDSVPDESKQKQKQTVQKIVSIKTKN
jgi:hypothetical protein